MSINKALVKRLPIFSGVSDKLLDLVVKNSVLKTIPVNQQIAYQGMESEWFFVLLEGSIRVYKMSESGREVTLYKVEEDESCILTIFSILTDKSYPAYASSQTEIKVLMIPSKPFKQWINENSSLRDHIFDSLSGRLNDILETFDKVIFQRVDTRVAQFLYNKCKKDGDVVNITHDQLSQEIGTSRVVVSRILEGFESESLISLSRGRIAILDRTKLLDK